MIHVALVGTGGMAHNHAENYAKISGCKVTDVYDVNLDRAKDFAAKFKIKRVHDQLDELLSRSAVQAVDIVAPDPFHKELSLKAIAAGKHLLCEKPLALCYPDAKEMAEAAAQAGVINMVNFSYRNSSAIHKAQQLIAEGELGKVRHVEANYLQSWLACDIWGDWKTADQWLWRLSSEHGSKGVLGDIGVHILDFVSYPVGPMSAIRCKLKCFDKAENNQIGAYTLDANDSAIMQVEFANGALGSITTTRWATGHANSLNLAIFGDKGALKIDLDDSMTSLKICRGADRHTAQWQTLECEATPNMYERFIDGIRNGSQDGASFSRGAAIQKALDSCFESDATDRTISLS